MILCQVYKSSRKPETYLYVEYTEGLNKVPEPLLKRFGEAVPILSLALDARRKLARVDVKKVLRALENEGYFLQLPPSPAAARRARD